MSSVRAFMAVPIPPLTKDSIGRLQQHLKAQTPNVRWTQPDNLHLTIHFFGDIDQETLEKVKVSMLSVGGCLHPFDVDIQGLGAFPSLRRPRVVWLGLSQQDRLRQLHCKVQQSLQQAGITPDTRPYSPHLTIGRVKKKTEGLVERAVTLSDTPIGHLCINKLVLYESRLQLDGAQHIPLLEVALDD